MKGLVYTQYGQNIRSFCPTWMGRPKYLDQKDHLISFVKLFSLLKWPQGFPFLVQQGWNLVKQTLE